MVKSIYQDPVALERAIKLTRWRARPTIVAAILRGYRSSEVMEVCRGYARANGIDTKRGPETKGDARVDLDSHARRLYLSAAVSLYERAIRLGIHEAEALLRSYESYTDHLVRLRAAKACIDFERYYTLIRAYSETSIKLKECMTCRTQHLVANAPEVPRECPFCALNTKGVFRRLVAPTVIIGADRKTASAEAG